MQTLLIAKRLRNNCLCDDGLNLHGNLCDGKIFNWKNSRWYFCYGKLG